MIDSVSWPVVILVSVTGWTLYFVMQYRAWKRDQK